MLTASLSKSSRFRNARACATGKSGHLPELQLIGDLSVYENVELPSPTGAWHRATKDRVIAALGARRHGAPRQHLPIQLSGGQQQRVAVARAVGGSPSILLADEPTGNLDSKNGESVMELMRELHREGATICMVTHDPRYAQHADRSIYLFDGRVIGAEEMAALAGNMEPMPYGRGAAATL